LWFVGSPEKQAESRGDGTEFRRRPEGQVDLQGVIQQEHPIKRDTPGHIDVMDGSMLPVHTVGPVSEHLAEFGVSGNAQCEINVRPPIFRTDDG
jgi:hypothetical protein